MAEITAALDEKGANKLLDTVIAAIPPQSKSGSGNLGPFLASYSITGTLTNGDVDLIPPDTIRIADLQLDWSLSLNGQTSRVVPPEILSPHLPQTPVNVFTAAFPRRAF
jgi:hypothetical protein